MNSPLVTYEKAIAALTSANAAEKADYQHAAVLALARAGSLDFALAEYSRYGLNNIRHHEDIMALGGRLYKDLYLSSSGANAKEYARQSAEKYEAAYKDTNGFYSGINAATMSLLGGVPPEMVQMRAQRILETLPEISEVSGDNVYFTEATRAEAYLLLGRTEEAFAALQNARDYDPLNYMALASTLKQFRMILSARDADMAWLSGFNPPRAVHFAGHIFGTAGEVKNINVLTEDEQAALLVEISETIQSQDIGFAHGALAAGSDILIAEAILNEGGELHVVLPVEIDEFKAVSVTPFGSSWVSRFEACMDQAASVTIFDSLPGWPDSRLQYRASLTSMGAAIRQSDDLSVKAGQLLIWDGQKGPQGTAYDAHLWAQSGRDQFILSYPGARNKQGRQKASVLYDYQAVLKQSGQSDKTGFEDLLPAIESAEAARASQNSISQLIYLDLVSKEASHEIAVPSASVMPGAIQMNQLAANYLAVHYGADYRTDYMGLDDQGRHIFTLRSG